MSRRASVIANNQETVEMMEDVMAALSHELDLAASLLPARRLLREDNHPYVLLDNEFPARSAGGTPRIQNAENFLDDLATAKGKGTIPVIVMLDKAAGKPMGLGSSIQARSRPTVSWPPCS